MGCALAEGESRESSGQLLRHPKETERWYQRFLIYVECGPERSISKAYEQWCVSEERAVKTVPDTWYRQATECQWEGRALLWDYEVWLKWRWLAMTQSRESVDRLIRVMDIMIKRLGRAAMQLGDDQAKWGDVINGIKILSGEVRAIYALMGSQLMDETQVLDQWEQTSTREGVGDEQTQAAAEEESQRQGPWITGQKVVPGTEVQIRRAEFKALPGGQDAFYKDWLHRVLFLEGGWGSGKTFIGARKLLCLHLYNAFDENGDASYVPSVLVGPTYRNMADVMFPAIEAAARSLFHLKLEYKSKDSSFIFPDLGTKERPSRLMARSAKRPELITGWEVGAAWGDEAARWRRDDSDPTRDAYLQLTARLRHPEARCRQLLLTYTNEGDRTRVYEEARCGNTDHALYRAKTVDNPAVSTFYEQQRSLLSPELAQQYLDGKVARHSMMSVYPMFDMQVHVDSDLAWEQGLNVQMMLDFNIQPGMHGLLGQYDPRLDELRVLEEWTGPGMSLREWLLQFSAWWKSQSFVTGTVVEVFGDASGRGRWSGNGHTHYDMVAACLDELGVPWQLHLPSYNPAVEDRINTFNCALRDIQGKAYWKCHPRCQRLIADLQQMKRDARGVPDKSDPRLSHASDAEGYRVWMLRPIRRGTQHPAITRVNV